VEGRPEPLRLFDLDLPQPVGSQIEAPKCPSQTETPPPLSEIETDDPEVEDRAHQLQVVAEEATMVMDARRRLEAAIEAARFAGRSWRQIGIAAGVPYQTLHRRHRQGGRT
jgi:DNA-directed RNA polymerase specialized sigma24 family protein